MKLKVYVLELGIPATVKRRALLIGIPALLLGVSAIAIAEVPHSFADGDTLSAAMMNENFNKLDERLAKSEVFTNPDTMDRYSLHAGVCGVTATATNGNIGGYAAAKVSCELQCGSDTAHMCDGMELMRWKATNGDILAGVHWYAGGSTSLYNDNTLLLTKNDCDSYKFGSANRMGSIWTEGAGVEGPGFGQCDESHKIVCCD